MLYNVLSLLGPYVVNVCIYIYICARGYVYLSLSICILSLSLSICILSLSLSLLSSLSSLSLSIYHYHIYILYTAIGKSDAASNWPLDQLERGKKIIRSESQAARHFFYLEKASGYIFINYTMA